MLRLKEILLERAGSALVQVETLFRVWIGYLAGIRRNRCRCFFLIFVMPTQRSFEALKRLFNFAAHGPSDCGTDFLDCPLPELE
jgi:hypothetical protein